MTILLIVVGLLIADYLAGYLVFLIATEILNRIQKGRTWLFKLPLIEALRKPFTLPIGEFKEKGILGLVIFVCLMLFWPLTMPILLIKDKI